MSKTILWQVGFYTFVVMIPW